MKIRHDIADMLRAGHTDLEVAARLGCTERDALRTRLALGLPPTPLDRLFAERTEQGPDGHVRWTGNRSRDGGPILYLGNNRAISGVRVAFLLRHGHQPTGPVRSSCGVQYCVAPDHVADQRMRDRDRQAFAAIFGSST